MKADIPGFRCNNCGICCKKYVGNLSATIGDMERWADEGRNDILERAYPLLPDPADWVNLDSADLIADLWFTKAGNEHYACPWWHRSTGCRIHSTKPQMCRDYPVSLEQAMSDECEGVDQGHQRFEAHATLNPKKESST